MRASELLEGCFACGNFEEAAAMDVYKSFHDFLRALYVFLEPLFSVLAWFIHQGYLLGCSLTQWFKVKITKQARAHRNKKVKSSDLKCGRFLGEGCSGIIYEATWSRGRNISLIARKAFPAVPADVFEYEAALLVELDHPNIVKVLGWTVDRRSCSIVMDHVKYNLYSVVQKRKEAMAMKNGAKVNFRSTVPIPLREAVDIMLQIAEGMKYVHEQRLAHGDLKPNNVLVDSESGLMLVRVTDFGLTETKKRSTTLVSHRARCLHILKWKAPELFEDLLDSCTEDSENMWTEMFPDFEVVKTSHGSSSVTMESAESKMQLADVYSFALTCSYILGAQVPHDSHLGLHELRNGISSGARPHLPFECPKMLASLISASWDTIPSRRPAFIDICKEMRIVKWELKQHEGKVQEYRNSKPRGSRKGGLPRKARIFSKGRKKSSLIVSNNKRWKTAAVDNKHESTVGNLLHISKEILDHGPEVFHSATRARSDILVSNAHWTKAVTILSRAEWSEIEKSNAQENQIVREKFEKLKAHSERGHLFFDLNESGLEVKEMIAEGGQSRLYKGEWKRDDGKFDSVAIKEFKDPDFTITEPLINFFNSKGTVANLRTSRVMRPLGGTLLKNGRFALVHERFWGDLRQLIDFQMMKNKYINMPPFKQEMAIEIMLQIAEGVAELHEFGIIHRDVKAANVLVHDLEEFSPGGMHGLISCALIDFEDSLGVVGTGFWRAPEILTLLKMRTPPSKFVFKLSVFTPSVDVYSYGMTCYEILTGKIPFEGFPSGRDTIDLVLCGIRPELPAHVHPQLRDLVKRCWDADPSKRPTSKEIVLLLRNIQTGK